MVWGPNLDLPGALEEQLPPVVTELIVAFAAIGAAIGLRLVLNAVAPGVVPFALTFPAIVAATLLAGTRAGLMTLVGALLLVWYMILPPERSFAITSATTAFNLLLVTAAQLVMLWAVSSYRSVTMAKRDRDKRQIDGLELALAEIDHRTKNNFQISISLLTMEAQRTDNAALKLALSRAAARLQAVASVYHNLAVSSVGLGQIRLHEYLADICQRLREGLLTPAIQLDLRADPAVVSQELAVRAGLIVNELVTNAAKHAFPDGVGRIEVVLAVQGDRLLLAVGDNGCGLSAMPRGDGLGTRLVHMLAQQMAAEPVVNSNGGTCHEFRIPLAAS